MLNAHHEIKSPWNPRVIPHHHNQNEWVRLGYLEMITVRCPRRDYRPLVFLGACLIIPPPLDRIPGMWKQDISLLHQDPQRSSEIESFVISCTRDSESSTFRGPVPFVL